MWVAVLTLGAACTSAVAEGEVVVGAVPVVDALPWVVVKE